MNVIDLPDYQDKCAVPTKLCLEVGDHVAIGGDVFAIIYDPATMLARAINVRTGINLNTFGTTLQNTRHITRHEADTILRGNLAEAVLL